MCNTNIIYLQILSYKLAYCFIYEVHIYLLHFKRVFRLNIPEMMTSNISFDIFL